jgi:ATP-binding cassette subfamily F protein 3
VSLVRLTEVGKYFGGEKVFGSVSATIEAGDKIGLIGRNGAGKTTLIRLIAGLEQPDTGEIGLARNGVVGFMRQGTDLHESGSLWDYTAKARGDVILLGSRLEQLELAMADQSVHSDAGRLAEVLDEYARVRGRFEYVGGYSNDATIRATLFGLGFVEAEFEMAFPALSGGQKARAQLARLLLASPDLLLLDEPTNHLDMSAVEWLEQYLRDYKGTLVAVSHDRVFLDSVVNRVWELEDGSLFTYNGNYSVSRSVRQERRVRLEKEFLAQERKVADLEEYVRRYKAGNRSTMAKSRDKMLNRLERVQKPSTDVSAMSVRLSAGLRSGKEVVSLDRIGKAYGKAQVLTEVSLLVRRGERIGVVGSNGSGKSTLLKLMAGLIKPSSGGVRYGKDVVIGYFSQELSELDPNNTVIDELLTARHLRLFEARSHLARFMFRGEEVFKAVGVLSGGERNRLTLAKLVLSEANLLLLDEPTNHLDIPSREALEESLQAYQGTLIFVSHDRYFLSKLARRVWSVSDGRVEDFPGTYEEYRAMLAGLEQKTLPVRGYESGQLQRTAEQERRAAERAAEREARNAAAALQELEDAIAAAEEEKQRLEAILANTALYSDAEQAKAVTTAHREVLDSLEGLYAKWAEQATVVERQGASGFS